MACLAVPLSKPGSNDGRLFDNFKFVDHNAILARAKAEGRDPEELLAVEALGELPGVFKACKALKLLK